MRIFHRLLPRSSSRFSHAPGALCYRPVQKTHRPIGCHSLATGYVQLGECYLRTRIGQRETGSVDRKIEDLSQCAEIAGVAVCVSEKIAAMEPPNEQDLLLHREVRMDAADPDGPCCARASLRPCQPGVRRLFALTTRRTGSNFCGCPPPRRYPAGGRSVAPAGCKALNPGRVNDEYGG